MKKISKNLLYISICIMFIMQIFAIFNFTGNASTGIASASGVQQQNLSVENHSVFIHTPTHTAIFDQKVFFVDSYDECIKVYDIQTEKFNSNILTLLGYTVIDSAYSGKNMFLLVTHEMQTKILVVSLEKILENGSSPATFISLSSSINDYDKINVEYFEGSSSNYLIALTPKSSSLASSMVILTDTTFNALKVVNISTVGGATNEKIVKFLILKSTETEYYFIFGYNNELYYSPCTISSIAGSTGSQSTTLTKFPTDAIQKDSSTVICDINFIAINDDETSTKVETAFVLTFYNPDETRYSSSVYGYNINNSDGTQTKFTLITSLSIAQSGTVISSSNEYFIYPDGQTINYLSVTKNSSGTYTKKLKTPIKNPEVVAEYYTDNNYQYMTANKNTQVLSSPWADEPLHSVSKNEDVAVVGYGKIKETDDEISDYYFCLFTSGDTNYLGYVKKQDLTQKQVYENPNYTNFPVFKVVSNTRLYSLPTNATKIITEDTSYYTHFIPTSSLIKDNSKVTLVDTICKYTVNGRAFVRVKVNGTDVGYIDADNVLFSGDSRNFVVTNASIKSNNTVVYREDGTIIDVLNKDFRVRINGVRNTKTGKTSITYNDEYGNEFTGYISTDSVKANSWSSLQILGSVLIAVNIGLLILILIFAKRKVGVHGEKYKKSQKANYKENSID